MILRYRENYEIKFVRWQSFDYEIKSQNYDIEGWNLVIKSLN